MAPEVILLLVQGLFTAMTAGLTLIPAFTKMKAERKKEEATAKKEEATAVQTLSDTAMQMLEKQREREDKLSARLSEVEEEMEKLKRHLRYWQRGCALLIRQLVSAGMEPCWDPNGGPDDEDERTEE